MLFEPTAAVSFPVRLEADYPQRLCQNARPTELKYNPSFGFNSEGEVHPGIRA